MMTGEEISAVLQGLGPVSDPEVCLACPLHLAADDELDDGCRGNPDAQLAAHFLGWPRRVCQAIADRFDGDGRWPEAADKRAALYRKRFTLSVLAGRKACRELDDPGSTF